MMEGCLFDTNLLIDVAIPDPIWGPWSRAQLDAASARKQAFINPIIYAELVPVFVFEEALNAFLGSLIVQRLPLPYEAGWSASQAFQKYRRTGGARRSPLPDFYIGAHAEFAGLTLVTRDTVRYATYFPGVALLAPPR